MRAIRRTSRARACYTAQPHHTAPGPWPGPPPSSPLPHPVNCDRCVTLWHTRGIPRPWRHASTTWRRCPLRRQAGPSRAAGVGLGAAADGGGASGASSCSAAVAVAVAVDVAVAVAVTDERYHAAKTSAYIASSRACRRVAAGWSRARWSARGRAAMARPAARTSLSRPLQRRERGGERFEGRPRCRPLLRPWIGLFLPAVCPTRGSPLSSPLMWAGADARLRCCVVVCR